MRKTIKRLGAVLLAMAMAVSVLCTGALAADTTYSITVKPAVSGHTYEAYQVFKGTVATGDDKKKVLSDIEWGSGVNSTELVEELQNTENNPLSTDFSEKNTAVDIAAVVAGYDSDKIKKFATVVGKHLQTTATGTSGEFDSTNQIYTISGLSAGYYLVKDKDNTVNAENHDAYTNYIMEVVQNVEVTPKTAVPTVTKKIVEDGDKKNATTAKVGDVVNFELTGTLPDNYADYTKYQYEFHDTLSKGLTYNGDVEVFVKNGETETKLASTSYTVEPENRQTTTPSQDTTITVKFADLKKNTVTGANNTTVTIGKDSKIIVKYSATLNENAVVGEAGNTNTVNLVYSNNPNNTSTGTTKDDKATVYTFQLNVTKVDGTNSGTKLAGAKFKLYYETDNTRYYVKEVTNDNTIKSWTNTENEALELTTDSNGDITVKGLKEGTYYLEETKAPDGYNKLTAPVKVDIANDSTDIHKLDSVKADGVDGIVSDDKAIGTITVANNKGSTLPSTGGMGTKLFYTIGGILMAGAAIVLVVRKRRSDAE